MAVLFSLYFFVLNTTASLFQIWESEFDRSTVQCEYFVFKLSFSFFHFYALLNFSFCVSSRTDFSASQESILLNEIVHLHIYTNIYICLQTHASIYRHKRSTAIELVSLLHFAASPSPLLSPNKITLPCVCKRMVFLYFFFVALCKRLFAFPRLLLIVFCWCLQNHGELKFLAISRQLTYILPH